MAAITNTFEFLDLSTWFCRKWVATVSDAVSCLFISPGLDFVESNWLSTLTSILHPLTNPLLSLQFVRHYFLWLTFKPAHLTLQKVNFHCLSTVLNLLTKFFLHSADCEPLLSLIIFKLVVLADSWFCSLWAATVSDTHSSPLIKSTLALQFGSYCPSLDLFWGTNSAHLDLQKVSHYCVLISNLLTKVTFCIAVCEWL